ncbi:hypothetical protein FHS42_004314, partial [Streptomyces zagrosensis]|nr:hypothetical protein [Streptomyces zagrosensis]
MTRAPGAHRADLPGLLSCRPCDVVLTEGGILGD